MGGEQIEPITALSLMAEMIVCSIYMALTMCHTLSNFIFTTTPWDRCYCSSRFADEEIEAQINTLPMITVWQSQDFNPSSLGPEFMFLTIIL